MAQSSLITDPIKDPFGQAMWAYYKGNLEAQVQVYSDLAIEDVIPVSYLFRSRSQMPGWETLALDRCRGKVIDLGAGAGSHSLELQNMGWEVMAMDISPGAVKLMESRGVRHTLHQNWQAFDGEPVDTILLMMNGIGLVGDLRGLNEFLKKARNWLLPGGQILLDSSDIAYLYDLQPELMPEDAYYGVVRYQMTFGEYIGDIFDWLYVDFPRLVQHARSYGYECEKLVEGNHHEYLARLSLKSA